MRIATVAIVGAALLLAVPAALAKDFRPGDLRVCGRDGCVAIRGPTVLKLLSAYYYGPRSAPRVSAPRTGSVAFELRFRNGYTTAVVATARLDRFRAHGVNCDRFNRGAWYRFPARAAAALRKLAEDLRPFRVAPPPRSC